MDYRKAFPSEYLKASDLQDESGAYFTVTYTIKSADVEDIGQNGERKLVLHFQENGLKMVMNRTNADECGLMFGNDTEHWIGQRVILWVDPNVRFGNKITPGLRIAAPNTTPVASQAPPVMAPQNGLAGLTTPAQMAQVWSELQADGTAVGLTIKGLPQGEIPLDKFQEWQIKAREKVNAARAAMAPAPVAAPVAGPFDDDDPFADD